MGKKISRFGILAVMALAFVVYAAILLLTADLSKGTLWIGFGFTVVACLISMAVIWFTTQTTIREDAAYFDSPIWAVAPAYMVVAMVVGVVAALLPAASWKGLLIVEILVHAVFWIGLVISVLTISKVQQMKEENDSRESVIYK